MNPVSLFKTGKFSDNFSCKDKSFPSTCACFYFLNFLFFPIFSVKVKLPLYIIKDILKQITFLNFFSRTPAWMETELKIKFVCILFFLFNLKSEDKSRLINIVFCRLVWQLLEIRLRKYRIPNVFLWYL